jgi:hypothetical protein
MKVSGSKVNRELIIPSLLTILLTVGDGIAIPNFADN